MKKELCVLTIIALMVGLTACGSSKPSASEAMNDTQTIEQETLADGDIEDIRDYADENAVADGISPEEELIEHETKAEAYEDSSEDNDYSDTDAETETSQADPEVFVSSENFWQGDDYFDLEEFLWKNGASNAFPVDMRIEPVEETGNEIYGYQAYFFDRQWAIVICREFCYIARMSDYKTYSFPGHDTGNYVTINQSGTQITRENLDAAITMVQYLKMYPNEDNPLSGSGIGYN